MMIKAKRHGFEALSYAFIIELKNHPEYISDGAVFIANFINEGGVEKTVREELEKNPAGFWNINCDSALERLDSAALVHENDSITRNLLLDFYRELYQIYSSYARKHEKQSSVSNYSPRDYEQKRDGMTREERSRPIPPEFIVGVYSQY